MEKNLRKAICSCLFSFLLAGSAYTANPADQNTGLITPPESKSTEQLDPTSSDYIKKSLVQLESRQYQLYDGLLVFPLLDQNGKTTQLGTFIAIMGMFRATYVPEKIINLSFPETETQYYCYGYTRDGVKLMPSDMENTKTSLGAKYQATGSFIMDGGTFKVTLKFEGPLGEKVFEKTGEKQQLPDIPLWIASKIHEYLGIRISEEQRKYLSRPEFTSVESMLEAARAEDLYLTASVQHPNQLGQETLKTYAKLSLENPDSVFLLAQYFNLANNNFTSNPLAILNKAHKEFPTHDRINRLYVYWFNSRKNFKEAVPLLMQLLERNYKTPQVYEYLDELLRFRNLSGLLMVYDYWVNHDPENYLAYLKRGSCYVDYAWEARGVGLAKTVREKGWGDFHERLMLAEKDLKEAFQLNPEDASAPVNLIYVGLGLGKDLDYINKWFDIAIKIDPENSSTYGNKTAYDNKIFYLTPKWYGSKKQMLDFTEECLRNCPKSSIAYTLLWNFHDWDPARGGKNIYNDPDVWENIKDIFTPYLSKKPKTHNVRNLLAKYAVENNDNDYALQLFTTIGTYGDYLCWDSFDSFLEVREKVFQAMFPNLAHEDYYQTLVSAYKKRVESNPDDVSAYLDLADLYSKKKEYDLAISQCLKVRELDFSQYEAFAKLGDIYYQQGKYEQAIEEFQKTILRCFNTTKPWKAAYYYTLEGKCYEAMGNNEKAVQVYEEGMGPADYYLSENFTDGLPIGSGYYYELAEKLSYLYYFNLNQPDKALPIFKKLDNPYAHWCLGKIFESKGDIEKAIENYGEAASAPEERYKDSSWYIWYIKQAKEDLARIMKGREKETEQK